MRALLLCLLILVPCLEARADDEFAAERKARDAIVRIVERLASEARAKGDVMAAQALAETCLHVSGVPHPHEDSVREAIVDGIPGSADETVWLNEEWKAVAPHVKVLAASSRDWDVLDARLVAQLPLVLPEVRRLNAARTAVGLKGMRYDAKRCIRDIELARAAVRSKTLEDKIRHGNRTVIPVAPGLAAHLFLNDPALRVGLFDPGDKGITIGTWPRKVAPPDPRYKVEQPWRHRLFATCLGWSGNRNNLWRGPKGYRVFPSPDERLHLWETRMQEHLLHGALTPMPVTLHGFGPMPPKGATIEVSSARRKDPDGEGEEVSGIVDRHGANGNWALAFRFVSELQPLGDYVFVLYAKDGRELYRWTMKTTSGKG